LNLIKSEIEELTKLCVKQSGMLFAFGNVKLVREKLLNGSERNCMKIKKTEKTRQRKDKPKKYYKPISLWPLKPEDALRTFMQVDPNKVKLSAGY